LLEGCKGIKKKESEKQYYKTQIGLPEALHPGLIKELNIVTRARQALN
jgi:hypothetical protein